MQTFNEWILKEGHDIFGFEKIQTKKEIIQNQDLPLNPITADTILETMMKREILGNSPFSQFHDQIQWGSTSGAVQMAISPLGSYKSIIRKLQPDLEGNLQWTCQRILPYKDLLKTDRSFDEHMAEEIFEKIEAIYKEEIYAPSHEYEGLAKLTIKTANECTKKDKIPEIFIFTGLKEIKKNENYLILFECKGHGVEAPGSMRLEQFVIEMSYSKSTGMIRSFGYGIQSPTRQHLWQPQPSKWDEKSSSSQDSEQISRSIAAALSTF
jgi:hypothetical protein